MTTRDLGELELFSLLAIQHLGGAALGIEIRDEIRRGGDDLDRDALEELFDLLELARAE